MARIPAGEQFGQVVARPGPIVQHDPNAYGAGVGQAVTRAGAIGMEIAGQDIAQANAEAKQLAREQAAEAIRLQREQEQEAKQLAREAQRTKTTVAVGTARTGLKLLEVEVSRDLEEGKLTLDELPSQWESRSKRIVEDAGQGVDAAHRPLYAASMVDEMGSGQIALSKLTVQHNRKQILANGTNFQEQLQRYAALGPKEADEAITNFRAFWTATAPSAGEDAATAGRRVQAFAEGVRSNQAVVLVNTDPAAALKALKNPQYLPELDPNQRTTLINNADAAVLRNQQRGALQAEASARALEKELNAVVEVHKAGKFLTAQSASQMERKFRNTPYEAVFKSLMVDAPANTAFVAQPIPAQAQALIDMQARMNTQGVNPKQDLKAYEQMDTAHKEAIKEINEDPYKAALERGVLPSLAPLSLDLKQLPGQLAARAEQANTVSRWAGQEVSIFRPVEATKISNVLQAMPPKDRSGAIAGITREMTPGQRVAFAKQIATHDRATELAIGMSTNYTSGNRYASEIMLVGNQTLKDKAISPENDAVSGIRARVAAEIGETLSGKTRQDVIDAAIYMYYGMKKEGINGGERRAVELAIGGKLADLNGRRIPLPAGLSLDTFKDRLAATSAPELQKQSPDGAVYGPDMRPVPVAEFLTELPRSQLLPVGNGRYNVRHGAGVAVNKAGKPIVIEVR
jgi:hypothetical protein